MELDIPRVLCHPIHELDKEAPRKPRRGAKRRGGALVDENNCENTFARRRDSARIALRVVDLGDLLAWRCTGGGAMS